MMRKSFLLFLMLLATSVILAQDDLPEAPGMIAYIGSDYNVYVLDMGSGQVIQHTDNASDDQHYLWPTWSTNNKLAFFCCESGVFGDFRTDVYVSPDGIVSPEVVFSAEDRTFAYAYWAPADCASGDKCRDLAVLLGGAGAFDVQLIRVHDEITNRLVGMGAPFYYSWSPDAGQLLLQRNSHNLELYDVATQDIEALDGIPGRIQAPQWSPVDDRLLVGLSHETTPVTDLVILDGDNVEPVADDLSGLVSANWSPDGRYVAYRAADAELGDLYVYDTESGEIVLQTGVSGVISFFWSPDSSKIAFVTFADTPGASSISTRTVRQVEDRLAWWVVDVETGETTRMADFVPTREMIYLLHFFDQFARVTVSGRQTAPIWFMQLK